MLFITLSNPYLSCDFQGDEEFPILGVYLSHKEGCVAKAIFHLPNTIHPCKEKWITLWYQQGERRVPLFYGCYSGTPISLDEYTKKIEYLAIPFDVQEQHQELVDQLKKQGLVDERFICPNERHNQAEYLEATPQLFCYDRVSHKVHLSDVFEGRESLRISNQILSGSLHVNQKESPLQGVSLRVVYEWLQVNQGEMTVMPQIEAQFVDGKISTLTPDSLIQSWPLTGQVLGRSGYTVVKSSLFEVSEGIEKSLTPTIQGNQYKKTFLQGELTIGWSYRQKRREIFTLDVEHVTQNQFLREKNSKVITLQLSESPTQNLSSFFDTPDGLSALQHALKIAQCHLAYSSRSLEVSFEIPFEDAVGIHLDQTIEISHSSLPGGQVKGKLIFYQLRADGVMSSAFLKVAVSTGVGEIENQKIIFKEDSPIRGITEKEIENNFLDSVQVENSVNEQMEFLKEIDSPKLIPPDKGTRLQLFLKDIRSVDVLERVIQGGTIRWSAPCQWKG